MWSCETFTNRIFGCTFYKQENNYVKALQLSVKNLVMEYKKHGHDNNKLSFYNIFIQQYKNRSFAGKRLVYSQDKEEFEGLCLNAAEALTGFFIEYKPTHLLDEYVWRAKIKGYIGCRIIHNGREYNVDFTMDGLKDTFYHLYYHRFNNWIYNKINGLSNDMLVFNVPTNQYYMLKYKEEDYTIGRGFLTLNINKKAHRPGNQCLTCKIRDCKPRLISNLERL